MAPAKYISGFTRLVLEPFPYRAPLVKNRLEGLGFYGAAGAVLLLRENGRVFSDGEGRGAGPYSPLAYVVVMMMMMMIMSSHGILAIFLHG